MPDDQMRYDLLTQEALRGVVRAALTRAANDGLPGDHHFYISFSTEDPEVEISDALRSRYPDEMTIVIQHQYWGLEVLDEEFRVGLKFGGVPESLVIPFGSVKGFYDPSVQFGLQFANDDAEGVEGSSHLPGLANSDEATKAADSEDAVEEDSTGEVVSLDAFRKK
jgi:hypothetical protein